MELQSQHNGCKNCLSSALLVNLSQQAFLSEGECFIWVVAAVHFITRNIKFCLFKIVTIISAYSYRVCFSLLSYRVLFWFLFYLWSGRKVVKSWLGSQVIERHKARLSGNPSATLTTLSPIFDIALLIFGGTYHWTAHHHSINSYLRPQVPGVPKSSLLVIGKNVLLARALIMSWTRSQQRSRVVFQCLHYSNRTYQEHVFWAGPLTWGNSLSLVQKESRS